METAKNSKFNDLLNLFINFTMIWIIFDSNTKWLYIFLIYQILFIYFLHFNSQFIFSLHIC
jgi:hypothetical protein